jgi:hypothetical protein
LTNTALNAKSYLRCRALAPVSRPPLVEESYRTPARPNSADGNPALIDTSRVVFAYEGKPRLTLVHLLELGDGKPAALTPGVKVETGAKAVRVLLDGKTYSFTAVPPFDVSRHEL